MRIRWRGLELPGRVELDKQVSTDTYGRFAAEPFERGFGTTIGNSLRRILLSLIEGAAVTQFKLKGAGHEFTSIPGVMEDVTEIVLNVKSLYVKMDGDEPQTLTLHKTTAGEITAGDIECPTGVEVINKDLVIATLSEDVEFDMTLQVAKGRGYQTDRDNMADAEDEGEIEAGVTFVDSNFSPIRRVRYNTDNARVGQKTDYDRLVLEVWTDGSITPEMALVEAGKILRKHLNPFVQYFELGDQLASDEAVSGLQQARTTTTVDPDLEQKLNMTVQELDLSVRANNCLESARINTVRELVEKKESELLKVRSFGKTSLREVKRRLADMGLSLGMDLEAIQNGTAVAPGAMDSFSMPDDDAVDAPMGEADDADHNEAAPEEAAADQ